MNVSTEIYQWVH